MYSLIIVDDEDITKMAICGYIQKRHPQFEISGLFDNGAEALNYLREHPVHVVITDIRMPRVDGLQLAKYIYENLPGTIVIIVSGYGEFEYARKDINYGVSTYLLKPLNFQELSDNLEKLTKRLDIFQQEPDLDNEEIQVFFTDLIGGLITDKRDFHNRFKKLSLTKNSADYNGTLITVTLTGSTLSRWDYGLETLSTALQNGIRMLLPNYESYYLFRRNLKFYFIILSTDNIPVIFSEELSNALFHLLSFESTIKTKSVFENLETLVPASLTKPRKSSATAENPASNDDIIIQNALEYIQSHYNEDLSREDVANAVFLSPTYFSKLFKKKTELNFIDYLTTIRMQRAIELIGTRMKIADIAKKVGYTHRNRFTINFQQYTGYTPTDYRRYVLKMEDYNEE